MAVIPYFIYPLRKSTTAITSDDRVVWRCAQVNQMLLITANRSMKGEDSLEQVMREENTPTSLPVVTIGSIAVATKLRTLGAKGVWGLPPPAKGSTPAPRPNQSGYGYIDRLLAESGYRDRCVNRLVSIVVDIEDYQGA